MSSQSNPVPPPGGEQILLTHRNEVLELRKLHQQLLEELKEVGVFNGLRGNRHHCLGMAEGISQIIGRQSRIQRHQDGP